MATPCRLTPPSAVAERTGQVREYRSADLQAVVDLRRRVFQSSEQRTPEALSTYFERMFGRTTGGTGGVSSLVYENEHGEVAGFQGAIEQGMRWQGRSIRVAVATQLMVAPDHRGLAGRSLVRTLLAGPQDLTISDVANNVARRLWESVGGGCTLQHSFAWTETIRPLRHRANQAVVRGAGTTLRAALYAARPLLAAGDAVFTTRLPTPAGVRAAPLDPNAMAKAAEAVFAGYALHPVYSADGIDRMLTQLRGKRLFGDLDGAVVWDETDQVLGWFLYYRNGGGECEVIQVAGRPHRRAAVLDLLHVHARERGGVAFTGRIDPGMLPELAQRGVALRHQGPWVVFHSRQAEVCEAIRRGDAYLSRLDGEWWMNF